MKPGPSDSESSVIDYRPSLSGDLGIDSWDAIDHEYGHYVAGLAGFLGSGGLNHVLTRNIRVHQKSPLIDITDGDRQMAWNEGWADYFAVISQLVEGDARLGLRPNVGDHSFHNDLLDTIDDASYPFAAGEALGGQHIAYFLATLAERLSCDVSRRRCALQSCLIKPFENAV